MIIERLDLTDENTAEELWSLQHAAYRVEASLIGVADLPPLRESVADLMACGETFWGCRTEDGDLVGAISTEEETEGGTVALCRVMVHPEHFRQGVGRLLLTHAIGAYPGDVRWEVTAEKRNLPAIALYEKLGFRAVETFAPRPDIAMLRMRLEPGAGGEAKT
ncbi:GNAT family N-acetyltransferase [Cohnella xylanilytica]|uniref:GNAT family N-acetyltransferase n=1 Tax=Cohnella xylanilytica TaxID=557555 RepID=A0A841U2Q1_9BACL|nr:GNAT family N-acetyltransferase [Cohnella xylanilytica]MBB6694816.1 GNAT family N-acetyltransferase [Cohnella xylanilytica]